MAVSAENLNRTSDVIESPIVIEIPRVNVTPKIVKNTRVNVDVLKQRIIEQKKKEKVKRTVFFSTVSLGVLTLLAS
jgi:uncharacterized protein (DUF111 family)